MRTNSSSLPSALALVLVSAACATTSFTSTWKAPDAQPVTLAAKKVVALVMSPNETTRREAETSLARALTARGANGVPAHTMAGVDPENEAATKARFDAEKVDGVVVMRAVGARTETTYTPGMWSAQPYYRGFYGGYYRYGWASVREPGYLRTDRIVTVETLVYSLGQDRLIWGATSQTSNPSDVDKFVTQLAGRVATQMTKEGLLR